MLRSDSLAKLLPALIKASASFKPISKQRTNPHFRSKYAALEDVDAAVDPALHDNGLHVTYVSHESAAGSVSIEAVLWHTSGEHMGSGPLVLLPAKADPQGAVAAITYARRTTKLCVLGLCAEDDDDGNGASQGNGQQPKAPRPSDQSAKGGVEDYL
jgi:hypothetical protein